MSDIAFRHDRACPAISIIAPCQYKRDARLGRIVNRRGPRTGFGGCGQLIVICDAVVRGRASFARGASAGDTIVSGGAGPALPYLEGDLVNVAYGPREKRRGVAEVEGA